MFARQSGLGRGLGALIPPKNPLSPQAADVDDQVVVVSPEETDEVKPDTDRIHYLPIDSIDPNPHQPRHHFDHAQLEDLITSIQTHGVMQPIVVTPSGGGRFELIAGERRLRASKIASLDTIPAIVRTANEQEKLELALIENIQRQELNALEEAEAYLRLQNEFNLTQEELAKRVGKSRSQVANTLRLMNLPQPIKDALAQQKISASNARTLLSLPTEEDQLAMFARMLEGNFTVRQTEARIPHRRPRNPQLFDANLNSAEERLRGSLGVKVTIKRTPRGEGEIRIAFLNDEDFNSIFDRIIGAQGIENT
ncbi:MAG: ParB/RepB/Spo0J family partition protein [Patescibacteria group bacterium]|nr:ParB/RepB/Spo0J family partition protein [Patescibacteria group bacterium]